MQFPTEKHLQEFNGDLFNYENLSKIILDEFLLKMELPNCFGLYGNWGSGKSTMIHYILNHIENRPENYKTITPVYFEPWKYEYSSEKDLFYALLACIKEKIGIKKNVWKKLAVDILAISTGVLRTTQVVDTKDCVADLELFEDKIFEEHENWVDKIESFRETLQKIVDLAIKKNKTTKLIIFIDDLDRCLPENAVKLLEGIKNFLSVKNTLFLLAIDKRIIAEMIEKKYGLHYGYGDEYLMKIIQYYYDLPKNDIKNLTKEVLTSYGILFDEAQLKYINNFLQTFGSEPRIAKHHLHQFCMNITLSKGAKELLESDNEKTQLQFFFVASYLLTKFPKLFTTGDNRHILGYLRGCAQTKLETSHPERYSQYVERDKSIDTNDRKKLEEILEHPINNKRESSPPPIMDTAKLSIALMRLKVQQ